MKHIQTLIGVNGDIYDVTCFINSHPGEGIRFSTNCNATLTNVTAVTSFWG